MEKIAMNIIADKITSLTSDDDPSLSAVDNAVDKMLISIQEIQDNINNILITTPEEEKAKKQIIEIMETAINPYMSDLIEALTIFEGAGE